MSENPYYDALGRWDQAGAAKAAQLVRITGLYEGNRYQARPIAFDAGGQTEIVGPVTLTVTNLAEPAEGPGEVPSSTDALAIDAGGRWVVFIRKPPRAVFPARIVSSEGGAAYTVREQVVGSGGDLEDAPGATDLTACNLAERSLGPGAAVDEDAIVLVLAVTDGGSPPTIRYFVDLPTYAKYLD